MGNRGVAMLDLVAAEMLDRIAKFVLVIAEARFLSGVMLLDHVFDRFGGGHRRPGAQKRRCNPQRITGDMPQR